MKRRTERQDESGFHRGGAERLERPTADERNRRGSNGHFMMSTTAAANSLKSNSPCLRVSVVKKNLTSRM